MRGAPAPYVASRQAFVSPAHRIDMSTRSGSSPETVYGFHCLTGGITVSTS